MENRPFYIDFLHGILHGWNDPNNFVVFYSIIASKVLSVVAFHSIILAMSDRKRAASPSDKSKRSDPEVSSPENPNDETTSSPQSICKDSSSGSSKSKKKTSASPSPTTGSGSSPPSLRLNHQLFSFEGKSSSRKRPYTGKKETTVTTTIATVSTPPYTSTSKNNNADDIASRNNNNNNNNNSNWGPVYRGSIQHMVLQKINVLDEERLQENPFMGANSRRRRSSSLLMQEKPRDAAIMTSLGHSSSSIQAIRDIVLDIPRSKQAPAVLAKETTGVIPEVTFRPTVLPQAPAFRKGDRVIIKRRENGQPSDTGTYHAIKNA